MKKFLLSGAITFNLCLNAYAMEEHSETDSPIKVSVQFQQQSIETTLSPEDNALIDPQVNLVLAALTIEMRSNDSQKMKFDFVGKILRSALVNFSDILNSKENWKVPENLLLHFNEKIFDKWHSMKLFSAYPTGYKFSMLPYFFKTFTKDELDKITKLDVTRSINVKRDFDPCKTHLLYYTWGIKETTREKDFLYLSDPKKMNDALAWGYFDQYPLLVMQGVETGLIYRKYSQSMLNFFKGFWDFEKISNRFSRVRDMIRGNNDLPHTVQNPFEETVFVYMEQFFRMMIEDCGLKQDWNEKIQSLTAILEFIALLKKNEISKFLVESEYLQRYNRLLYVTRWFAEDQFSKCELSSEEGKNSIEDVNLFLFLSAHEFLPYSFLRDLLEKTEAVKDLKMSKILIKTRLGKLSNSQQKVLDLLAERNFLPLENEILENKQELLAIESTKRETQGHLMVAATQAQLPVVRNEKFSLDAFIQKIVKGKKKTVSEQIYNWIVFGNLETIETVLKADLPIIPHLVSASLERIKQEEFNAANEETISLAKQYLENKQKEKEKAKSKKKKQNNESEVIDWREKVEQIKPKITVQVKLSQELKEDCRAFCKMPDSNISFEQLKKTLKQLGGDISHHNNKVFVSFCVMPGAKETRIVTQEEYKSSKNEEKYRACFGTHEFHANKTNYDPEFYHAAKETVKELFDF